MILLALRILALLVTSGPFLFLWEYVMKIELSGEEQGQGPPSRGVRAPHYVNVGRAGYAGNVLTPSIVPGQCNGDL